MNDAEKRALLLDATTTLARAAVLLELAAERERMRDGVPCDEDYEDSSIACLAVSRRLRNLVADEDAAAERCKASPEDEW